MREQHEEAFFKGVMSKSKLELPFSDFEDAVMMQIKKQELYRKARSRDIKMSWVSFITGTAFGIMLSLLLPHFQISLFGISPNNLVSIFQILFSLFVLFSLESLVSYTRKISINHLFKDHRDLHSMDRG